MSFVEKHAHRPMTDVETIRAKRPHREILSLPSGARVSGDEQPGFAAFAEGNCWRFVRRAIAAQPILRAPRGPP